ncbi:MAG: hypothetical protein OHK0039_29860 [Bacteroidia bacterium]
MKPIKHNRPGLFPSLDAIWDDFFGRNFFDLDRLTPAVPATNIRDNGDAFELELALPGLKKEDVRIELDHNVLTIASRQETSHEEKDEQGNYARREFYFQRFSRSFNLPETVDQTAISARSEDGILHVRLPKRAEAQTSAVKLIEIQ